MYFYVFKSVLKKPTILNYTHVIGNLGIYELLTS